MYVKNTPYVSVEHNDGVFALYIQYIRQFLMYSRLCVSDIDTWSSPLGTDSWLLLLRSLFFFLLLVFPVKQDSRTLTNYNYLIHYRNLKVTWHFQHTDHS